MSTRDFFVNKSVGKEVQIAAKGKKITKTGDNPQTCYTQKIISSQDVSIIHKWIFKINRRDHELVIGITSNYKTTDGAFHRNMKDINYGYSVKNGQKVSQNKYNDYGCSCNRNDKIEMILNLKKKQLSFIVNGINQGICYCDITQSRDIKYRVAIFVQTNGTAITLLKYQQINIDHETEEKKVSVNTKTNSNNNNNNIAIKNILKQLDEQKMTQQKMERKLKNALQEIKEIKSVLNKQSKQNKYMKSDLMVDNSEKDGELNASSSKCSCKTFISNVKMVCYVLFALMIIVFIGMYGYGQYFGNKHDL
eukprot:109137_1